MTVQIPVERLRALCDPFINPWAGEPFTQADVRAAIEQGRLRHVCFTTARKPWDTQAHIERIAYLVVHGWHGPINVDVGIPSMGFSVDWPVQDGNHRLAAAIYLGAPVIEASVSGDLDYAQQLFFVDVSEVIA